MVAMNNRKNLIFWASCFIIAFSGLYFNRVCISPNYIFGFFGCFLLFMALSIYKKGVSLPICYWLAGFLFFYFFLAQYFLHANTSALVGMLFSLVVFTAGGICLSKLSKQAVITIGLVFLGVSMIILSYESFYRLLNPIALDFYRSTGRKELLIYPFKFNSIMFLDSNFAGLYCLVLFFFNDILAYYYFAKKFFVFRWIVLAGLLILTLSRASIITCLVSYPVYIALRKRKNPVKQLKVIFILSFLILLPFVYLYRNIDDSLSSKFGILRSARDLFVQLPLLNKFFGIGFGNTMSALNIGAHNILVVYILEGGVIGAGFVSILWYMIIKSTKNIALIILLPIIINGLSLTSTSMPYLYACLSILVCLSIRSDH